MDGCLSLLWAPFEMLFGMIFSSLECLFGCLFLILIFGCFAFGAVVIFLLERGAIL